MTAFGLAVCPSEIGDFEKTAIAPLSVRHRRLRQSVPTPEKIRPVRLRSSWHRSQCCSRVRRQRHVYRLSGLRLVKKQLVALAQTLSFERDGVSNAQTAPRHQQRQSTDSRSVAGLAPVVAIEIGRVEDSFEFVSGSRTIQAIDNTELIDSRNRKSSRSGVPQTHMATTISHGFAKAEPGKNTQPATDLLLPRSVCLLSRNFQCPSPMPRRHRTFLLILLLASPAYEYL